MKSLADRTLEFIEENGLLRPGERVAVAVSGGADSVALLRVMLELRAKHGIVVSVAHFNHKIRGAESDKDAEFVRAVAARHERELHRASADTPKFAREKKMGLEAAARELRYKFFAALIETGKADKIATAHTLDDQAETVLMRLVRGAGPAGLAGVLPGLASEGRAEKTIVRPFLRARRGEPRKYLEALGQGWREDASNASDEFLRNRVRRQLLPELEKFNPAIREILAHLAEVAREEEEYWAGKIAEILSIYGRRRERGALTLGALQKEKVAVQRRLIRALAKEAGLAMDFEHVEKVRRALTAAKPAMIEVPRGRAEIKNKELRLALSERALGGRRKENHSTARHRDAQEPKAHDLLIGEVRGEEAVEKSRGRGTMPGGESR